MQNGVSLGPGGDSLLKLQRSQEQRWAPAGGLITTDALAGFFHPHVHIVKSRALLRVDLFLRGPFSSHRSPFLDCPPPFLCCSFGILRPPCSVLCCLKLVFILEDIYSNNNNIMNLYHPLTKGVILSKGTLKDVAMQILSHFEFSA